MSTPRLAAGVVVVRDGRSGPEYLLLRAYAYWDFPKGEVEPGEEPLETAEREAAEEAGLRGLSFRWGTLHQETAPYRGHGGMKVARYYLAAAPESAEAFLPIAPELGRPEHHELRWLSREEARERLSQRLVPVLEWAHALVTRESRRQPDG